ncbi:diaminopimelate epimerase [bacterium]|nr:diaminopimelate epimerase [bacterium]
MRFTKLHGLGNDYIYINTLEEDLSGYDVPRLSEVLSNRNFGVGGDGIILVLPSTVADFRMRIFNADGSEAEMCGNGVRAFSKYLYEHGLTTKTELAIETGAGIIRPSLTVEGGVVKLVRVDMGEPRLARKDLPAAGEPADQPIVAQPLSIGGHDLSITCVSMGNPHCVLFVEDAASFPVSEIGPRIERHELFPKRTNVEFATVQDRSHIVMRVWERGSGVTLACGTGTCATVVAATLNELVDRGEIHVSLLGGELVAEWASNNHVFLTGPAAEAFSGEVHPDLLAQARK